MDVIKLKERISNNTWLIYVILFLVCLAAYGNSLTNGFNFDDNLVLDNPHAHHIKYLYRNFTWTDQSEDYRPFPHLVSMLNYLAFQEKPFGYHAVNLILFFIAGISLYVMMYHLCDNRWLASLCALFFLSHPINSMLVDYTAMSCSVIVFSLNFAIIQYLSALKEKFSFHLTCSLLWFAVGLLSHESTIMFPLYLAAILYCAKGFSLKDSARRVMPFVVTAGLYVFFRIAIIGFRGPSLIHRITAFDVSLPVYIASFSRLIVWYLSKLIYLKDIVVIWNMPPVQDHVGWWVAGFGIFLLGFLYFICSVRKGLGPLGLWWFAIGFIPVTIGCLFRPPLGFVIEPHWLFFSSIGYFILVAQWISKTISNRRMAVSAVTVLVVLNVLSSRHLNAQWKDQATYSRYWLAIAPRNLFAMRFLADELMDRDPQGAEVLFKKLLLEDWYKDEIYNNLGLIEMRRKNYAAAVAYFQKSLEVRPRSATTYTNLGAALAWLKDDQAAQAAYAKAIDLDPILIEPRMNLAIIYREQKQYPLAIELLKKVQDIDPYNGSSLVLLSRVALEAGDGALALTTAKNILARVNNARQLTKAGSFFAAAHFSETALALFARSLEIDPNNKRTYIELGKLWGNEKHYQEAINIWKEGLRRFPDEHVFKDLVAKAVELSKDKTSNNQ